MTLPLPAQWFLYLRKSNGYASIPRQRDSTTDHIAARGGTVITPDYEDADRTAWRHIGAARPPRPRFDAMLDEMERRPGTGIGAWHADRLARDPEDAETLIRACVKGGHLITTARGGDYDLTTGTGRKHFRDDINQAAYEVDNTMERVIPGRAQAAAEGRWLGGPRPFGWQPAGNGALDLDDAEAALIAQGSADVLAGIAVRAIARAWNAAGFTGTSGARWNTHTVRAVLMRPRNAGLAEHHGQILAVTATWPAIVDKDTWRAVRAILASPARRSNHGSTAAAHLMTGIALCGGCGVSVAVDNSAENSPRYRCSRHFRGLAARPGPHASRRAADVDAFIAALVMGRLEREDAARLLRPDHSGQRRELAGNEAALQADFDGLHPLWRARTLTDAEFTRDRAEISARLAVVRGQLAALDEADVLAPMLADPRRAWDGAPLGQRRAVVAALMYVTLMPGTKFSRPPGWKFGDGQFDARMVDVRWVRRLPSDG